MAVIGSQFESEYADARVVLQDVSCNPSVFVGAIVIMNSGVAVNAIADSLANSNMIGIVESKSSLEKCNIRVSGVTDGNIFSGLDETKEYFLSDSVGGQITSIPPSASSHVLLRIGQPFSSTKMLVLKGTRVIRL